MYSTLIFKSLGSVGFLKEMNAFIQQGCIKLIKSDSEMTSDRISISDKCCSLELSIHQRAQNVKHFPEKHNCTTVFNIVSNNNCFLSSKSVY